VSPSGDNDREVFRPGLPTQLQLRRDEDIDIVDVCTFEHFGQYPEMQLSEAHGQAPLLELPSLPETLEGILEAPELVASHRGLWHLEAKDEAPGIVPEEWVQRCIAQYQANNVGVQLPDEIVAVSTFEHITPAPEPQLHEELLVVDESANENAVRNFMGAQRKSAQKIAVPQPEAEAEPCSPSLGPTMPRPSGLLSQIEEEESAVQTVPMVVPYKQVQHWPLEQIVHVVVPEVMLPESGQAANEIVVVEVPELLLRERMQKGGTFSSSTKACQQSSKGAAENAEEENSESGEEHRDESFVEQVDQVDCSVPTVVEDLVATADRHDVVVRANGC